MFDVKLTYSQRMKVLMDGNLMFRIIRSFADKLRLAWHKESGSKRWWRIGIGAAGRRFINDQTAYLKAQGVKGARRRARMAYLKPVPNMLTVRTNTLRTSIMTPGRADSISSIKVATDGSKFDITLGSRVPYANRQERQKGGARSYVRRAGNFILSSADTLKRLMGQAVKEVFKNG